MRFAWLRRRLRVLEARFLDRGILGVFAAVSAVAVLTAVHFGVLWLRQWDDWDKCRTWTVGQWEEEPAYRQRAVELCVSGRRAYRAGFAGSVSDLRTRAAGRCGAFWASFEVPPENVDVLPLGLLETYKLDGPLADTQEHERRFMDACVPARTAELEARMVNGGD
jgi:hypothetical protein